MRPLVLLLLASLLAAPDEPPPRTPETITYDRPDRYVRIPASAGDVSRLREEAGSLRDEDPEQTIRNVWAFVEGAVPNVPTRSWPAEPQDVPSLLLGFDHRDCARHALLVGNLLRACGVPAVYVKSMRHDWIRRFVATGDTGSYDGHVFLEVHVGGTWRLLDAQGMRILDAYDPDDPELPGGFLAYEKGSDHLAMVHSTRRDLYREETKARFRGFDPATLRPAERTMRRLLPPVWAITLDDEWKVLSDRIPGLVSMDRPHWASRKRQIREGVLIVTSMGGRVGIPDDEAPDWLPVTLPQLRAHFRDGKTGLRAGQRPDGTVVLLLAAPGRVELMQLIWSTDFAKLRAKVGR